MNESEKYRLQGLMRPASILSVASSGEFGGSSSAGKQPTTRWERWKVYMINEGSRRIFVCVWVFLHAVIYCFGFLNVNNLNNARHTFHITYPIARSAALVLHFDVAFLMFPVCRNFISILRRGPLNGVIPFEKNITFHIAVAWSIVFFTVVHVVAHIFNAVWLALLSAPASDPKTRFLTFWAVSFVTGPGITGWIMNFVLGIMVWFAMEKRRRANFERFWYSHHLFIVFFVNWQLHGMFCMIKPDRPPYCDPRQVGVFWKYWIWGGAIYIYERILREVRARHRTYISKVILHPSKVVEIQIKKEKTTTRAGQYIFLNCPEVSYWQWHPFTLTSAPEEDYISVHIRIVGDFTEALARALGCQLPTKGEKQSKDVGAQVVPPPLNKVLPRVMVDGPFGSASEDVFKFEVSILCGAGIGVTPFASILKSIWYRLNFPEKGKRTRLQKVYFFWICRDYDSFEWFQSLLSAIEEQDLEQRIEIHTYLTAKKEDDINNIYAQDVGAERDAVTNLRAPTHYGRPNWSKIFQSIAKKHPATEAGVFFCGPKALGHTLHLKCNENSTADGVKFIWGKENF
ncbi:NADPH oxidase B [Meredithblackwellia eburnea MCA 4105]